jgi:alpha-beta hydrolase superfamily lysophospholipase
LGVRETDVEMLSGGDVCRAWFFVPEEVDAPVPCLVMGHGFGLTRRCGLREFAETFAGAGYAVVLFDYRGFGDSGGIPRQLVSFRKQLEDWGTAVDFARAQPEVDSNRVITWGFSLGAGHALTVAARDGGVAAVVAVAPMFDGLSSTLAAARRWGVFRFFRVVARAAKDWIGSWFGRPPIMIPITANPGELGLLTSPDAYPGYRAIVPRDFNYETAARVALLFWTYLPGLLLRRFRRAILVLPSKIDKVNPPGPTIRRANRCESATIVELDCEHMEIALDPHRSRITQSTLDFLGQHLPSR